MITGYRTIQVDITCKMSAKDSYSFAQDSLEMDKFAQVMALCRSLSDDKPFRPEWLFNKEMPEEVKLYLRSIFQQRIKGITTSLDVSQLTDEQLLEFAPGNDETLEGYSSRVTEFINSIKSEGSE